MAPSERDSRVAVRCVSAGLRVAGVAASRRRGVAASLCWAGRGRSPRPRQTTAHGHEPCDLVTSSAQRCGEARPRRHARLHVAASAGMRHAAPAPRVSAQLWARLCACAPCARAPQPTERAASAWVRPAALVCQTLSPRITGFCGIEITRINKVMLTLLVDLCGMPSLLCAALASARRCMSAPVYECMSVPHLPESDETRKEALRTGTVPGMPYGTEIEQKPGTGTAPALRHWPSGTGAPTEGALLAR